MAKSFAEKMSISIIDINSVNIGIRTYKYRPRNQLVYLGSNSRVNVDKRAIGLYLVI